MYHLTVKVIQPKEQVPVPDSSYALTLILLNDLKQIDFALLQAKAARENNSRGLILGVTLECHFRNTALIPFLSEVDGMIYLPSQQEMELPGAIFSSLEHALFGIDFWDLSQALGSGHSVFMFDRNFDDIRTISSSIPAWFEEIQKRLETRSLRWNELLLSIAVNPKKCEGESALTISGEVVDLFSTREDAQILVMGNDSDSLQVPLQLTVMVFAH